MKKLVSSILMMAFFVLSNRAAIKLWLRRTLVRLALIQLF